MAGTDVLAGVTPALESGYASSQEFSSGDEWICHDSTWTVTATGTADGMAAWEGTDSGANPTYKMICTDGSGNILGTTDELVYVGSQWGIADFVTPFAVTVDDVVQLWFAMGSGYNHWKTDGASFGMNRDQSGSYASPPDTFNLTAGSGGEGSPALKLLGTIGGGASIIPQTMNTYRQRNNY